MNDLQKIRDRNNKIASIEEDIAHTAVSDFFADLDPVTLTDEGITSIVNEITEKKIDYNVMGYAKEALDAFLAKGSILDLVAKLMAYYDSKGEKITLGNVHSYIEKFKNERMKYSVYNKVIDILKNQLP